MTEGRDSVAKPPARRPGRPSLSNEALLDKAFALFLEQGFERTSIDAITASAGMAKRTVYQRYGDKETLFKEALKRAIDRWIVPLDRLRAAETDDLEETLLAIGRILVNNVLTPAGIGLLRVTNAESGRLPEIGGYTYQLGTGRTIAFLADLLRRRLDQNAAVAPDCWEEAGIAFLYLVVSGPPTMTAWGMSLTPDEVDYHTRFGVHLFLHGLIGTVAGGDVPAPPPSVPEPPAGELETLRAENARLRSLLVTAMLESAELRERD